MHRSPVQGATTVALVCAAILAAVYLLVLAGPALAAAAGSTTVEISWGEMLRNLLTIVGTVALALLAAAWAAVKVFIPAPIAALLDPVAERMIREVVDYSINAVDGAARGRTLTVDVGNRVLAEALRELDRRGDRYTKWLGGRPRVAKRILAMLDLEPQAVAMVDGDGEIKLQRGSA